MLSAFTERNFSELYQQAMVKSKVKGGVGGHYSHLLTLLRRIAKMRLSIELPGTPKIMQIKLIIECIVISMLRDCSARFISHEVTKKVIKGNRRLESRATAL